MGVIPEWWTEPYPEVKSASDATAYLDARGGAISRDEEDGQWVVRTGEQELYRSESADEVDAFLQGFVLGHAICERHGPIGGRPAQAD